MYHVCYKQVQLQDNAVRNDCLKRRKVGFPVGIFEQCYNFLSAMPHTLYVYYSPSWLGCYGPAAQAISVSMRSLSLFGRHAYICMHDLSSGGLPNDLSLNVCEEQSSSRSLYFEDDHFAEMRLGGRSRTLHIFFLSTSVLNDRSMPITS